MKNIEDYQEAFTINQYMVRLGDGTILLHFGGRNSVYRHEYGSEYLACLEWEQLTAHTNPYKIEYYADKFDRHQYMVRHTDGTVSVISNGVQRVFDNEPEACAFFKALADIKDVNEGRSTMSRIR